MARVWCDCVASLQPTPPPALINGGARGGGVIKGPLGRDLPSLLLYFWPLEAAAGWMGSRGLFSSCLTVKTVAGRQKVMMVRWQLCCDSPTVPAGAHPPTGRTQTRAAANSLLFTVWLQRNSEEEVQTLLAGPHMTLMNSQISWSLHAGGSRWVEALKNCVGGFMASCLLKTNLHFSWSAAADSQGDPNASRGKRSRFCPQTHCAFTLHLFSFSGWYR